MYLRVSSGIFGLWVAQRGAKIQKQREDTKIKNVSSVSSALCSEPLRILVHLLLKEENYKNNRPYKLYGDARNSIQIQFKLNSNSSLEQSRQSKAEKLITKINSILFVVSSGSKADDQVART
jgi:hypothetical protein